MTIYFTSDLHLGHRNIINFCRRPFHSVENMNKLLVMNWNEVVQPNDIVYVLGDVAMGQIKDSLPLVTQLNGEKFLVPGNHDRCWPGNDGNLDKIRDWKQKYEDVGFQVLSPIAYVLHKDRAVRLCHFPYRTVIGEYDERYGSYHPVDDGLPLFHGHIHTTWRSQANMVNVGVDVWNYAPVSFDRLLQEISPEKG